MLKAVSAGRTKLIAGRLVAVGVAAACLVGVAMGLFGNGRWWVATSVPVPSAVMAATLAIAIPPRLRRLRRLEDGGFAGSSGWVSSVGVGGVVVSADVGGDVVREGWESDDVVVGCALSCVSWSVGKLRVPPQLPQNRACISCGPFPQKGQKVAALSMSLLIYISWFR